MENNSKVLFVLQQNNPKFDLMPFSIARTWIDDKGVDIAIYLMYDSVNLVRKDTIEQTPDIKEAVDYLLSKGVPIYTCGFCTRACELNSDKYYPGIVVANRHIYFSLMMERKVVYY
jgi:predicted peroxiredoxin